MDQETFPKHVAMIMDGNGRWAEQQGLTRVEGHLKGAEVAKQVVDCCLKKPIEVLSFFGFSRENWGRPSEEVSAIMDIFFQSLTDQIARLHDRQVRVRFMGDRHSLPLTLQKKIRESEQLTVANSGLQLVMAFGYSGRWELLYAMKQIMAQVSSGQLNLQDLEEAHLKHYLCLPDIPEPDLLIRTSGEQRISNFMLWQLAYTELYFTPTLWPDFTQDSFQKALDFFSSRSRRFGLIHQQDHHVPKNA